MRSAFKATQCRFTSVDAVLLRPLQLQCLVLFPPALAECGIDELQNFTLYIHALQSRGQRMSSVICYSSLKTPLSTSTTMSI